MARMSLNGDECVKHSDIMEASDILARIRQLASVDDELRLMRGGPMVQTREELAEFVEVYNELVGGYILLKMDFLSLNADQKSMFQLAVDRMNVAREQETLVQLHVPAGGVRVDGRRGQAERPGRCRQQRLLHRAGGGEPTRESAPHGA